MSSYYYVYTEVKTPEGWKCVNQYLPKKDEKSGKERWVLIPTYESGSRSYFGNTYDELRYIGVGKPDNLSEAIALEHPEPERREEPSVLLDSYYENRVFAVPYKTFSNKTPKANQYQHCGFYHKDVIFSYETGEREDLFEAEVNTEEYNKLPQEIRDKCYRYYEWDNNWDWPYHFKIIKERSDLLIGQWMDFHNIWMEEYEARLIVYEY